MQIEIDLLGFYLDNGFNIGQAEYDGKMVLTMTLKSKELDPYFVGTAEGRNIQKPSLQMTKWWKDLLTYLAKKRPDRWVESSYVLLNTTKEDQEKCEKELARWKTKVKMSRVPHKYNWVSFLSGPEQRRFLIACYPYLTKDREERNAVINDILSSEEAAGTRGAICVGVDVSRNDYPYSVLASIETTNLLEEPDQYQPVTES